MFQTLAMDIRPIATVNSPVAVNAPPPAAPVTPAPAPEPVAPAVASTGPASPHDVSQGEDTPNGHGGSRRPGNLWTTEDREDMFNRREAGEGWETICADYPNRSRHAMQQQYSMMKKQKALADGTWASNRRGRKRRNPAPEKVPVVAKRNDLYVDADEQMTEADDFDEGTSDDPEDPDDPSVRMSNGRPNSLMRSSTEPTKSTRTRNASHAASAALNANGRASSQQAEGPPDTNYGPGRTSKKRRLSGDQASTVHASTPPYSAGYQPTNVMLDYDEVFALLRKGVEWARRSKTTLEEERNTRDDTYKQAIQRANRRATEAHERFSYVTYEHGEAVKKLRGEFAETLKNKTREYKDALEKQKAEADEERKHQYQQALAQSSQIDTLRKEIALLKQNMPDRERMMADQITQLQADNRALSDAKRVWEATAQSEPPAAAPAATNGAVAGAPSQPTAHSQELAERVTAVVAGSSAFADDFNKVANLIQKFQAEIEDLNNKRIIQYLADLVEVKNTAATQLSPLIQSVDQLQRTLASSATPAAAATPPPAKAPSHPPATTSVSDDRPRAAALPAEQPAVFSAPHVQAQASAAPGNFVSAPAAAAPLPPQHLPPVNETHLPPIRDEPPMQKSHLFSGHLPAPAYGAVPMATPTLPSHKPDVEMQDDAVKLEPRPSLAAFATTLSPMARPGPSPPQFLSQPPPPPPPQPPQPHPPAVVAPAGEHRPDISS